MERRTILIFSLLALLGLGISIYLTLYHYAGIPLICSDTGIVNCANVLNSSLASIFGIPIAIFGIIFFIGEFILIYIKNPEFLIIWNALGIGSVVYFVYLESVIGSICAWCTAVHVITVLLFGLSVREITIK